MSRAVSRGSFRFTQSSPSKFTCSAITPWHDAQQICATLIGIVVLRPEAAGGDALADGLPQEAVGVLLRVLLLRVLHVLGVLHEEEEPVLLRVLEGEVPRTPRRSS